MAQRNRHVLRAGPWSERVPVRPPSVFADGKAAISGFDTLQNGMPRSRLCESRDGTGGMFFYYLSKEINPRQRRASPPVGEYPLEEGEGGKRKAVKPLTPPRHNVALSPQGGEESSLE